ncbi:hypothetical protein DINM_000888 [Dirofilaria immitis]|nr:hypothetical protein [Dirofilaria immitis]
MRLLSRLIYHFQLFPSKDFYLNVWFIPQHQFCLPKTAHLKHTFNVYASFNDISTYVSHESSLIKCNVSVYFFMKVFVSVVPTSYQYVFLVGGRCLSVTSTCIVEIHCCLTMEPIILFVNGRLT